MHPIVNQISRREWLRRLAGAAVFVKAVSALKPVRAAAGWDDTFELAVTLELAQQSGYRSHRPYVAVWVQDATGRPVRTLSVWVQNTGRGRRYVNELRRWSTVERELERAGGPNLIATLSSATRMPGRYVVTWDGRDDRGQAVNQGPYRILIEAAREHGTYQLMQQDITIGAQPIGLDLSGNTEIARARVEYRRRK